ALRQSRAGRRSPAGAGRADRILRRAGFRKECRTPVQSPVDEYAASGLAGRKGQRVQSPPASAAVRAEHSCLQGGDFAAARRPGGAAVASERLDDSLAASLL